MTRYLLLNRYFHAMNRLYAFTILCLALGSNAAGQSLRDNNFSYLYHSDEPFLVSGVCYSEYEKSYFYFSFTTRGSHNTNEFQLSAELRESAGAKEGAPLPEPEWLTSAPTDRTARILLPPDASGKLVVLRVTLASARKPWWFCFTVPPLPAYTLLYRRKPVTARYIGVNQYVTFAGFEPQKPIIVSVYETDFPAALPPFTGGRVTVSPFIKPNRVFVHQPADSLSFSKKGLILVQQDTASAQGLAFRVEDDYPRFTTLQALAAPMMYICEKREIDRLQAATGNKPEFDKVILSILGDAERARIFMRNYFQRVEQANRLFTSYKEGWKTDRGMIYIIFGPPDAVYLLDTREIWEYNQTTHKESLTFVRSASLFDPNNFVLLRQPRYRDTWYNVVDLWRRARF